MTGVVDTRTNTIKYSYDYDAFGNQILNSATSTNIFSSGYNGEVEDTNPFRYAGEYFDRETVMIYLRNRYYIPRYGRFTQQDTHWNSSNMIYGDNQKAVKYAIINDQKIYFDQDGKVVEVEELNDKEIAKFVDKSDDSNQTIDKIYDVQRVPQLEAIVQSGNLYTYAMNNPVKYVDPSGKWVSGVGISAYAAFGLRIDVQGFYVWDDNGNQGIILIGGGGGGFPNAGISGSAFYSHNTDTIFDLEGVGMSTGGGFSYFGADFNRDFSGTVSAGVSVLPVDAHGIVTFGKIIVSW